MKFVLGVFCILMCSSTSAKSLTPADNCQGAKQEETILSVGSCEYGSCYVKTSPHNTQNFQKEVNLNIVPKEKAFVGEVHQFTSVYCIDKEIKSERVPASL